MYKSLSEDDELLSWSTSPPGSCGDGGVLASLSSLTDSSVSSGDLY